MARKEIAQGIGEVKIGPMSSGTGDTRFCPIHALPLLVESLMSLDSNDIQRLHETHCMSHVFSVANELLLDLLAIMGRIWSLT